MLSTYQQLLSVCETLPQILRIDRINALGAEGLFHRKINSQVAAKKEMFWCFHWAKFSINVNWPSRGCTPVASYVRLTVPNLTWTVIIIDAEILL